MKRSYKFSGGWWVYDYFVLMVLIFSGTHGTAQQWYSLDILKIPSPESVKIHHDSVVHL